MKKNINLKIVFLLSLCFAVIIFLFKFQTPRTLPKNETGLPNPASRYCIEMGYVWEIRTNPDGNQYGICIFPDGSECEEWAYYEGKCKPGKGHG
jgi:putative hemolysin